MSHCKIFNSLKSNIADFLTPIKVSNLFRVIVTLRFPRGKVLYHWSHWSLITTLNVLNSGAMRSRTRTTCRRSTSTSSRSRTATGATEARSGSGTTTPGSRTTPGEATAPTHSFKMRLERRYVNSPTDNFSPVNSSSTTRVPYLCNKTTRPLHNSPPDITLPLVTPFRGSGGLPTG